MWRRKNDVHSPKIGSPISDNFSLTTIDSACGDVKMMYAPPKLDPPCLTFFRRPLNMVMLRRKNDVRSHKIGSPMSEIFLPTTKYGDVETQK